MAREKVWVTRVGERIPYRNMSNQHLENTIAMLDSYARMRVRHIRGLKAERRMRMARDRDPVTVALRNTPQNVMTFLRDDTFSAFPARD